MTSKIESAAAGGDSADAVRQVYQLTQVLAEAAASTREALSPARALRKQPVEQPEDLALLSVAVAAEQLINSITAENARLQHKFHTERKRLLAAAICPEQVQAAAREALGNEHRCLYARTEYAGEWGFADEQLRNLLAPIAAQHLYRTADIIPLLFDEKATELLAKFCLNYHWLWKVVRESAKVQAQNAAAIKKPAMPITANSVLLALESLKKESAAQYMFGCFEKDDQKSWTAPEIAFGITCGALLVERREGRPISEWQVIRNPIFF
jgi:hypothetical protein